MFKLPMKNIFNPVYRQDYLDGFSHGLDPHLEFNVLDWSAAFTSGFNYGRLHYESMNGDVHDGSPKLIVTDEILEEFLLAGMLGLNIDSDGYTVFQLNVISRWYQSGIEKYDQDQSLYLLAILEENGIEVDNNK